MIVLASCSSNSSADELISTVISSSTSVETSVPVSFSQTSAPVQQTTQPPASTTAAPPVTSISTAITAAPLTAPKTISKINIQVGSKHFTATLHDNESAQAIVKEMPFTLKMDDFASQEKVARLSFALPSASTQTPATIRAGDIYLWSSDSLVLFYTTFSNSYSYVPVGYIEDVTGLRDALGAGSIAITFTVQ